MKLDGRNSQSEPQGIFNENLRRSFDKLSASRTNQGSTPQRRQLSQKPQMIQSGNIILVNTSSEEEAEDRKTASNRKFLTRDTKIRGAIKRGHRKMMTKPSCYPISDTTTASSGLTSSSAYSSGKSSCGRTFQFEESEVEAPPQLADFNSRKEKEISSLSSELRSVKHKLLEREIDNLALKKENSQLEEKLLRQSRLCSRFESELRFVKSQENEMVFVINKLNEIVQNQDEEIAKLKEENRLVHQEAKRPICHTCLENRNENSQFKKNIFGWMKPDVLDHRDSKLLETESKLAEQMEVNKQLKQYLELMLLKICDTN